LNRTFSREGVLGFANTRLSQWVSLLRVKMYATTLAICRRVSSQSGIRGCDVFSQTCRDNDVVDGIFAIEKKLGTLSRTCASPGFTE
jgi:hypothetical protein